MSRMSLDEARAIAADWHGGQWSALYMFASTGATFDGRYKRHDLLAEVAACRTLLYTDAYSTPQKAVEGPRLDALEAFLRTTQHEG